MTITLFGHRITIFQVEKLEKFTVKVDRDTTKAQAEEIKNNPRFAEIKRQAAQLRAERA